MCRVWAAGGIESAKIIPGRDIADLKVKVTVAGKVVLAVRPSNNGEEVGGLFGDSGDSVVDV
jgi:hypothetical protein